MIYCSSPNVTHNPKLKLDANLNDPPPDVEALPGLIDFSLNGTENRMFDRFKKGEKS